MPELSVIFGTIRQALNSALVPNDFPKMLSTTPKHPSLVQEDDEFPYLCMMYGGEKPEYEGSDVRWIRPSRHMSSLQIWVCIQEGEDDCLSIDLLLLVEKVKAVITSITSNMNNRFRVRVDDVEAIYADDNSWAMATITLVVGAYGT